MDPPAPLGTAVNAVLLLALLLLSPVLASAGERYVVVVSGASGGEKYAVLQHTWAETIVATLKKRFAFADANIVALTEENDGSSKATAENVTKLLADLRRRMTDGDTLLLILFGHGT